MSSSSTIQTQAERCGKCGASMREATADGFCPRCLLQNVLGALDEAESDGPELESTGTLLARRDFAGYELLCEMGRGGMGVVFKARQKRPDRLVALKVITSGELASPRMVERFHLEAKAAAGLHHPGIVAIHEVGHERGWHYFSMQLVDGETLAARLAKMSFETVSRSELHNKLGLVIKLAQAVHHAHQRGILHRDLKPANVLLNPQDEPFLTDFGLAKLIEGGTDFTRSQTIVGTPCYMAPEQGSGSGEISVATDIYGLGAILYELLCGQPPFMGETPARVLTKVLQDEPDAPSAILARRGARKSRGGEGAASSATRRLTQSFALLPRDVEVICLKCLEKKPALRYASALALAEDLERYLANLPIAARPISGVERGRKWVRRNPFRAALAGVLCVGAVVLIAGLTVFNLRLERARAESDRHAAQTRQQLSGKHLNDAARQANNGDSLVSILSLCEAHRQAEGDAAAQRAIRERISATSLLQPRLLRLRTLESAPLKFEFADESSERMRILLGDGRTISWNLRADLLEAADKPIAPLTNWVCYSHDGKWEVLLGGFKATVKDLLTGSNVTSIKVNGPVFDMNFGPDGKSFAMAIFRDQAMVYDTETWLLRSARLEHESGANKAVFSPDGMLLATAGFDYQAKVRRMTDFQPALPTFQQAALAQAMAFSPDGRLLAIGDATGLVRVWDLASRARAFLVDGVFQRQLRAHPNSQSMVTIGLNGMHVYDAETEREAHDFIPFNNPPAQVSFDGRGTRLGAALASEGAGFWEFPAHKPLLQLKGGKALARTFLNALVSPDGRLGLVATADGNAQLWDLNEGKPAGSAIRCGEKILFSFWSDDGRWISLGAGKSTRIWDVKNDRWAGEALDGGPNAIANVCAFSPDSRKIIVTFSNATIEPSAAQIYELPGLKPIGPPLRHGDGIAYAAFSPDGQIVATGGEDNVVRLWRVADGKPTAPDLRHRSIVRILAFRGDGRVLATGEAAGAVRLWDVARGELMAPPLNLRGGINALRFSPDGSRLMAATLKAESWSIKFDPESFPLDTLEKIAECETGLSANGSSGLLPISSEKLEEQFADLRARETNFARWPEDAEQWHLERAAIAETDLAWTSAEFHLRKLLSFRPFDEMIQQRIQHAQMQAAAPAP